MEDKTKKYLQVIEQIKAAYDEELELYTNLNNALAILKHNFKWFWTGLYILKGDVLYLGPYQGQIACTKIKLGKGVCGSAAKLKETIIVDDVTKCEGYIACHSEPKSEIVVPGIKNDQLKFVLDIDHTDYAAFDKTDKYYLEIIAGYLAELF